jgi:RNA polymerase sigma-70 factor, ECF subfamily
VASAADKLTRGLDDLRAAVAAALLPPASPLLAAADVRAGVERPAPGWLLSAVNTEADTDQDDRGPRRHGDSALATSSEESPQERERLIGLVELARNGDGDAFGMLFDHYQPSVYRFLYYRTRSVPVAEDLCSETFVRALRNMSNFRWQGRDFGAWLMTIARNLATDHFKASRTRLEMTTDDIGAHDDTTDGPEDAVLQHLTHEVLLEALKELPTEQRDCLIMRFLQGWSIAETAQALERSEGAVKQLQLRGVRNLAKAMPAGLRSQS